VPEKLIHFQYSVLHPHHVQPELQVPAAISVMTVMLATAGSPNQRARDGSSGGETSVSGCSYSSTVPKDWQMQLRNITKASKHQNPFFPDAGLCGKCFQHPGQLAFKAKVDILESL